NSFELFWPVVAGRTQGDSLYPIKRWKEKLRGWLIFGNLQKADYFLFLSVKRFVEIEKLIKQGDTPNALSTIQNVNIELDQASYILNMTKANGDTAGSIKHNINTRILNLKDFVTYLITKSDAEIKGKLQESKLKLDSLSKTI
ncbi:MAG: DUF5667 domain-containing protein, partial [Patescibacteria group bacterium]